jgi:uncharacterized protein YjbI with pentapeptide repeats
MNCRVVIFSSANFTCATLNGQYENVNFNNANFTNATLNSFFILGNTTFTNAVWSNTICPDGTNSDNNGNTCEGHLVP